MNNRYLIVSLGGVLLALLSSVVKARAGTTGGGGTGVMKPLPMQAPSTSQLTVRLKNPMALTGNDTWVGKTGKEGIFVVFSSVEYGIRAGMKNLRNGYFNLGIDTLNKIFLKYAPYGHGNNNPAGYAGNVSLWTGVGVDQKLSWDTHGALISWAIHMQEAGYQWIALSEFITVKQKYSL